MKRSVKFLAVSIACLSLLCTAPALAGCNGNYIDKLSVKGQTSYMTGEAFAGATLTVTYSNGKREQVEITEDMPGGFDTSVAGEKTVVVSYGGKTASFVISVSDFYAKEIAVSDDGKFEYIVDSGYADGDVDRIVSYHGRTETKSVTSDMIKGFDTGSEGKKTVSVGYGILSTSYEISVRQAYVTSASVADGTKRFYRVGGEFGGVTLDVVYETGATGTVIIDDVSAVKGFDTSSVGTRNVSVTYRNRTVSFDIEVAKAVKSVSVKTFDDLYAIGDGFKSASLDVVYDDDSGETIDVTADMVTKLDTSSAGIKTVKLDFEGTELSFDITVAGKLMSGETNKIQVEDGNFVDMSGAELQGSASNKFEKTTTLSSGEVVPNGAEGSSTANISVKGNKIVIRFISDAAGSYKLGLRAQSGSGAGRKDQAIQEAFKVFVNDSEVSISGTIGKASTGSNNWKDMINWTVLDSICEIDVEAGLNEIEFAYQGEDKDMRLPNIDYFILTAI